MARGPRAWLCASLGVALAGCAANEHLTHRSAIEGTALGLSSAAAPPMDPYWWRAFGDPQLDRLVERATRDSPTLAQALARVARAAADSQAASSARGPQVTGSAEVLRAYYNAGGIPLPESLHAGSAWGSILNLGVSWNLDFWGRQRDFVRASSAESAASLLDARSAELALEGSVVSTYIELDRDHALAELAAEVERNRAELADITRRRVSAGIDTNVDLRTATARIPEVRVDQEQARFRIALGVHELAALCGQGANAYPEIGRPKLASDRPLELPAALPADLLLRRPDIAAALARVRAADANEDAARLAAYPEIDLRGLAGFASLSVPDLLEHPARALAVGPALYLPIFDSGLIRARHRAANADLDQSIAAYDATVLEAVREVSDRLSSIAALDRIIREQEHDLELLTEARHLAEERFRAGLSTRLTVLEAEARILTTRSALISSRALAAEERVSLRVALGGSTEPPQALAPTVLPKVQP